MSTQELSPAAKAALQRYIRRRWYALAAAAVTVALANGGVLYAMWAQARSVVAELAAREAMTVLEKRVDGVASDLRSRVDEWKSDGRGEVEDLRFALRQLLIEVGAVQQQARALEANLTQYEEEARSATEAALRRVRAIEHEATGLEGEKGYERVLAVRDAVAALAESDALEVVAALREQSTESRRASAQQAQALSEQASALKVLAARVDRIDTKTAAGEFKSLTCTELIVVGGDARARIGAAKTGGGLEFSMRTEGESERSSWLAITSRGLTIGTAKEEHRVSLGVASERPALTLRGLAGVSELDDAHLQFDRDDATQLGLGSTAGGGTLELYPAKSAEGDVFRAPALKMGIASGYPNGIVTLSEPRSGRGIVTLSSRAERPSGAVLVYDAITGAQKALAVD